MLPPRGDRWLFYGMGVAPFTAVSQMRCFPKAASVTMACEIALSSSHFRKPQDSDTDMTFGKEKLCHFTC